MARAREGEHQAESIMALASCTPAAGLPVFRRFCRQGREGIGTIRDRLLRTALPYDQIPTKTCAPSGPLRRLSEGMEGAGDGRGRKSLSE